MATSTGPNLEAGRRASERLMDDTCQFLGATAKTGDGGFDPDTLEPLPGSQAAPYYDGPCTVSTRDVQPSEQTTPEGTSPTTTKYVVKVPIGDAAAAGAKSGDVVLVTSSRRDPALAGQRLLIDEVLFGTMSVSRKVLCSRRVEK